MGESKSGDPVVGSGQVEMGNRIVEMEVGGDVLVGGLDGRLDGVGKVEGIPSGNLRSPSEMEMEMGICAVAVEGGGESGSMVTGTGVGQIEVLSGNVTIPAEMAMELDAGAVAAERHESGSMDSGTGVTKIEDAPSSNVTLPSESRLDAGGVAAERGSSVGSGTNSMGSTTSDSSKSTSVSPRKKRSPQKREKSPPMSSADARRASMRVARGEEVAGYYWMGAVVPELPVGSRVERGSSGAEVGEGSSEEVVVKREDVGDGDAGVAMDVEIDQQRDEHERDETMGVVMDVGGSTDQPGDERFGVAVIPNQTGNTGTSSQVDMDLDSDSEGRRDERVSIPLTPVRSDDGDGREVFGGLQTPVRSDDKQTPLRSDDRLSTSLPPMGTVLGGDESDDSDEFPPAESVLRGHVNAPTNDEVIVVSSDDEEPQERRLTVDFSWLDEMNEWFMKGARSGPSLVLSRLENSQLAHRSQLAPGADVGGMDHEGQRDDVVVVYSDDEQQPTTNTNPNRIGLDLDLWWMDELNAQFENMDAALSSPSSSSGDTVIPKSSFMPLIDPVDLSSDDGDIEEQEEEIMTGVVRPKPMEDWSLSVRRRVARRRF